MRIVILSQWFTPEPTPKGLAFAQALRRRGHSVQILTGFPNYPGGKVYPGYRLQLTRKEDLDGIPVVRTILYPSHDNSRIGRIANYISFALSASFFGWFMLDRPDVLYVYHPPATVAFPAIILSAVWRVPFVYDIQDLWPDTLTATGMIRNRQVLALVAKWCRLTYRMARRIVVLSPGFKSTLERRGVPASRVDVIFNWCDESHVRRGPRNAQAARMLNLENKFLVIFAGTMGKAQDLEGVLTAAIQAKQAMPDVQFLFVGGGVEVGRLRAFAKLHELSNVSFLPARPMSEISEALNMADVLLVHLKKDPLFEITIPSKIQAYLAIGKPILAGAQGDAARLVESARAGMVYDPSSPSSLLEALAKMRALPAEELHRLGENGRAYYDRELAMAVGVIRFEKVFLQAVEPAGTCRTTQAAETTT